MDRADLTRFVETGATIREIADQRDMSHAGVRYWLRRYELKTRRAASRAAQIPPSNGTPLGTCPVHGQTEFVPRPDGYWRCRACRSAGVTRRRREVKNILVEEAGGACRLCGYNRCLAALQFHHVDRRTKSFAVAQNGVARSLYAARAEAAKCVLLCANCHAEVEAGIATLVAVSESAPSADSPG